MVDTTKWHTPPFSQHLSSWVKRQNKSKGLSDLQQQLSLLPSKAVWVTTRHGTNTLDDSDDTASSESDSDHTPQPHPGSTLTPTPLQPLQIPPGHQPDSPQSATMQPSSSGQHTADMSGSPRFRFWHQMSPEEQALRGHTRRGRSKHGPVPPMDVPAPPSPQAAPDRYASSACT